MYGVISRLRWPVKEPSAVLDYSYDATDDLAPVMDSVINITASIRPSGTGELQATAIALQGNLITLTLSGGVAGRDYVVLINAATIEQRVFAFPVRLLIDPAAATWPLPAPPSYGFGTPIVLTLPS